MKNQQDNTGVLPALLRTAGGVEPLETNSLCCAAAGIIAPSSATAEVLIPHDKLREAALADATLNAQECPLAQPVIGYRRLLLTLSLDVISCRFVFRATRKRNSSYARFVPVEPCNNSPRVHKIVPTALKLIRVLVNLIARIAVILRHPNGSTKSFGNLLLNHENGTKCLCRKRFIQKTSQRMTHLLQSRQADKARPGKGIFCDLMHCGISLISRVFGKTKSLHLNPNGILAFGFPFHLVRTLGDHKCPDNGCNRTDSLNPCSSTFRWPGPRNRSHSDAHDKGSWRGYCNFVEVLSLKTYFARKHKSLIPTLCLQSLIASKRVVHGGAV